MFYVGATTGGRGRHRGAFAAWILVGIAWLALGLYRLVVGFARGGYLDGLGVAQIAVGALWLLYVFVMRRREKRERT